MNWLTRRFAVKSTISLSILLAILVGVLAFPSSAAAKCAEVPEGLLCTELRYSLTPKRPVAGEEFTVIAYWIEQPTEQPLSDAQWLATRGKPAYIWLWDHNPSELESTAYVERMAGKVKLPQFVIPLEWNAKESQHEGSIVLPRPARWYFRLGTVVPDALKRSMEADFDYVGPIRTIDIPPATGPIFSKVTPSIISILMVGSGFVLAILLRLTRFFQKYARSDTRRSEG
jgi:hypothetical protein